MPHLNWVALFVIVAAIAKLLGFSGVAETAAAIAGAFLAAFVIVLAQGTAPRSPRAREPGGDAPTAPP